MGDGERQREYKVKLKDFFSVEAKDKKRSYEDLPLVAFVLPLLTTRTNHFTPWKQNASGSVVNALRAQEMRQGGRL